MSVIVTLFSSEGEIVWREDFDNVTSIDETLAYCKRAYPNGVRAVVDIAY